VPVITRLREQYRGTVHLFIGTWRGLLGITIMPLIRNYNGDSNIYGLKGHSTFMLVYKFPTLSNTPGWHDEGLGHDSRVASII
jgi:hypothetical protein